MANRVITVSLNQSLIDGQYSISTGSLADPNGTPPSTAAVAADVATLVADGATPTQAHVTTLNTDWGTFLTAQTAYTGGVSALTVNAAFFYDPAAVTTMNQARDILRALEQRLMGSGLSP